MTIFAGGGSVTEDAYQCLSARLHTGQATRPIAFAASPKWDGRIYNGR